MAAQSQISLYIANKLGGIEGELESRIQLEASKMLRKFSNQCPANDDLLSIVNTRNNLLRGVNQFQKSSNSFASFVRKLRSAIRAAKVILRFLLRNPTPVATGIPPSDYGGLATAKTAGQLTTLANRLYKVNKLLEELEGDVDAIESLVSGVAPSMDNVRNLLESVNTKVEDCIADQPSGTDEINRLLKSIQPLENTGSEGLPSEEFLHKGANGKNYILAIIKEQEGEGPVPRRTAVAKDNIGVIILRGQPSFSSDTKVLLDELKFRIDNQLP
jgi:methyl-accepting chemotaxis protein